MGYNSICTGWGNNMHVKGMRRFSPARRSSEYNRSSAIAGMRVTNYGDGAVLENMLFEDNVIVLKPEDDCTGYVVYGRLTA
jgi:hypothetical protein